MEDKGRNVLRAFSALEQERQQLNTVWEDAFRYTFPIRGQGFTNTYSDGGSLVNTAKAQSAEIYDSTAGESARLLASSMISGLTPSNSQWFNLAVPGNLATQVPYPVRSWLENSSDKLHNLIHTSNYDSEAFEFFLDIVVGGMSGLYIDQSGPGLRFEHWSLDTLYCAETLRENRIDTVYRVLNYTGTQAASEFGINNLPDSIREAIKNNPDDVRLYTFIHAIRPRMKNGKLVTGKQAQAMPWESIYVCRQSGTVVKESGYREFPVVIPRWLNIPKTVYATGPIDAALPDIKTLNKVKQMVLTNGELQIAGTFVAKEDGILNPNTIRIGPRRIIFAADVDNLKPLSSGGDFKFAEWMIIQLQKQIRKVLLSDQLQPQDGPMMTATEIQVRTQLVRRLLGPIYSRFQAEYLLPLIERCFGVALRAGLLGIPPDEIGGFEFSPVYQSPLARAQRLEDLENIQQYEQAMITLVQLNPEVLDLYDMDAAARKKAELLGVPVDVLRDSRQVAGIRKKRAEAQAQQAQAEQEAAMMQMAMEQKGNA